MTRNLIIGGAIGVGVLVILALAYVYWPAPGPSPAEDALKQQIEELQKRNEQLAAEAATRTEEANQLREDANAELEKVPAIRSRRRAARRDDAARRDAILATPDSDVARALTEQHRRTRERLRAVRAADTGTESNGGRDPRR